METTKKPVKRLITGLRCNSAATAMEFAIIAPVLFLLLIGIVELGLIFFTYSVLEGATDIGARIGKTGYTTGGLSSEAYIIQRIDSLSAGMIDTSKLQITVTSYSTFSEIGQTGDGVTGTGSGGDVVVYKVTYPWTVFTPIMSQLLTSNTGVMNISAVATVRNENF